MNAPSFPACALQHENVSDTMSLIKVSSYAEAIRGMLTEIVSLSSPSALAIGRAASWLSQTVADTETLLSGDLLEEFQRLGLTTTPGPTCDELFAVSVMLCTFLAGARAEPTFRFALEQAGLGSDPDDDAAGHRPGTYL